MFKLFFNTNYILCWIFILPSLAGENNNIDVYCTSNLDSTGVCTDGKTQSSFDCIIIPGHIIECKDKTFSKFECILTTQVTPTQAQFTCSKLISSDDHIVNDSSEILPNVLPNDFKNAF